MSADPWHLQRWAYGLTTGSAGRKAVLMILATMADPESCRCEAKVPTLVKATEIGERTVRSHLKALEDAGVIARRAQFRTDGGRRGDEFLLRAPGVTEWPDGTPLPDLQGGPASEGEGPGSQAAGQERPLGNGHASKHEQEAAREDPREAIPDDFPDELRPHARVVLVALRRIAEQHGAKAVHAGALARTMMGRPRKPFVRAVHDFEAWCVDPPRPIRDALSSYRTWIDRERDLQGFERLDGENGAGGTPARRPSRGGGPSASDFAALAGDDS